MKNLPSLYARLAEATDRTIGWDRLPVLLGLATLVGLRKRLRESNLYDTGVIYPDPMQTPDGGHHLVARTADGTYNDLQTPAMGAFSTRFGRNVPLPATYPEPDPAILSPNPRTVSRRLLYRETFQPATTLNLLAAAWLQFNVHDWLSHGQNTKDNPWKLPLAEDDPWPDRPMTILRTCPDPTHSPDDPSPPTYRNLATHWWDASQLYGSDEQTQRQVRSGEDGKLKIERDGLLPLDPDTGVDMTGVNGNWWIGLSLLHTLFTLEHNAICDRLRAEYPNWTDDDLFDKARLINAALIAKIHTVEWTPGILGNPALQIAMRGNWWGAAMERIHDLVGRISTSEVISGIPGSQTDHFGVPYSITEEFVAVYRMHPLIPDDFVFRSIRNDEVIDERQFRDVAFAGARPVIENVTMENALYSFGRMNPGAITLHNYPRNLMELREPDGTLNDLAATDILRVRERGVPRYNAFRQYLHKRPVKSFEEMTNNREWAEQIREVYDNDVDRVDLMVGLYSEPLPAGFGFSDTAFRIFILMASRRLNSDRFYTRDFTPTVYTPAGMKWIDDNSMTTVLLRHFPGLSPAMRNLKNPFAPWDTVAP